LQLCAIPSFRANFLAMNPATAAVQFKEILEAEMGAYGITLSQETLGGLARYYELLTTWNSRLHLVSFRSA
jgi:hypothetical protein